MTAETPAGTGTPAETPAGTADTLAETADTLAGRKGKANQVKLIVGASILALLAGFVTGSLVGARMRKRWDKFSHGY